MDSKINLTSKTAPTIPPERDHEEYIAQNPHKHYLKLFLLAIAGLLVILGFGVLVNHLTNKSAPTSDVSVPYSRSKTPTAVVLTPRVENIVITQGDKKIFKNTTHMYEVTIPSDWILSGESEVPRFTKLYPTPAYGENTISIIIHDNTQQLSLERWVTDNIINPATDRYAKDNITNKITRHATHINPYEAVEVTGAHLPARNDSLRIYFSANNKIVEFILFDYFDGKTELEKEGKKFIHEILSSFRFIK